MSSILDLIQESNTILLLTHESPDGDAIGSTMAFYHLLNNMKKTVDVVIPIVPETFSFLDSIDEVVTKCDKSYDLAIVLDCATVPRIGQINDEFSRCKKSVVIDHHMSNTRYGDINIVDDAASSCCEVLFYLFKEAKLNITPTIGEALAVGMLTDTAGFKNNNVTKETFLMAAELMDLGVDVHEVYSLVVSMKTMAQYALIKVALDHLEFIDDGKIAFSYISYEDMANAGAKLGDHEGLVELGRNVDGVEVSVFVREWEGVYRISLRSNGKVNVNDVAQKFGGGGHKMAAGIVSRDGFKETKEKVINEIKKELSK